MIVKIKDESFRLKIWLPTTLLKSKFIIKIIKKHIKINNELFDLFPLIYKELKKYIRKNGHFILIEALDDDGKFIIKV